MSLSGIFEIIVLNYNVLLVAGFGVAFIITYFSIPSIVTVAHEKKLYDVPNERTSHTQVTPSLGGIAVFAGLIISTCIFTLLGFSSELKYIIAGLIILFFFGIKDDILVLDPKKKLLAQVLAALLVAVLGDVRITNYHGFFGVYEINYWVSISSTAFFIIVLTNGFNLIDGIDGLASGIGILACLTLGPWFVVSGHTSYAVMCFALMGSLMAFFHFNVFGKKNKIFLGDTGSLILGLSISVFAIRFMEYEISTTGWTMVESTPAVTFGILIVPLFDTLRVFILRILHKRSPFSADRCHIHHRLLELGNSHRKSTAIILSCNLGFIVFSIACQNLGNIWLLISQLALALLLSWFMMHKVANKKKVERELLDSVGHSIKDQSKPMLVSK